MTIIPTLRRVGLIMSFVLLATAGLFLGHWFRTHNKPHVVTPPAPLTAQNATKSLYGQDGSGNKTVAMHNLPGQWLLSYTFSSASEAENCKFQVSVKGPSGAVQGKPLGGTGESGLGGQEFNLAGNYNLAVAAPDDCSWRVDVKTTP